MNADTFAKQPIAVSAADISITLSVCGVTVEHDDARVTYDRHPASRGYREPGRYAGLSQIEPDEPAGVELLTVEIGIWNRAARKYFWTDIIDALSESQIEAIEEELKND